MKEWISEKTKKLPWRTRDYIMYVRIFKRIPNLKKPKYFSEKLLCRKQNDCHINPIYTLLADKLLVRDYVELKIGADFLINLIYSTQDASTLIDVIDELGDVVIKPNHGAGMVHFFECTPAVDELRAQIDKFEKWLKVDFSEHACEYHYKNIDRFLLVEKRLRDKHPFLIDYKFHLFRQPDGTFWYILQIIDNRFRGDIMRTFFINSLSDSALDEYRNILELALSKSFVLADGIDYVRIDWYIVNDKLYFGELTLTPAAGFGTGFGAELDKLMGSKWHYNFPEKKA
ncbi:ATP-grasp fold amidoligase family protein [Erwinia oleae]|uniref:ATP-grasp fold amidoligase family protein n=1 Tax=Erwinia oleae TaxID=796334 RepID=UPI00068EE58F|nr:ATP-grasp fold amidoligase family protein [Erwinia oleae]